MLLCDLLESNLPLVRNTMGRVRGSYGAFIITMAPMDFLRLTSTPEVLADILARPFPLDADQYRDERGRDEGFGRFEMPFLNVAFPSGAVLGHEGRHRTAMVMRRGGKNIPVTIYPRRESVLHAEVSWWTADDEKTSTTLGPFSEYEDAQRASADFIAGLDPETYWPKSKISSSGGGAWKGAPARSVQPWDHAAWQVADFPDRLTGQFDKSVAVTEFRVGLVKGYSHFRR
jgi:hypothetical protein